MNVPCPTRRSLCILGPRGRGCQQVLREDVGPQHPRTPQVLCWHGPSKLHVAPGIRGLCMEPIIRHIHLHVGREAHPGCPCIAAGTSNGWQNPKHPLAGILKSGHSCRMEYYTAVKNNEKWKSQKIPWQDLIMLNLRTARWPAISLLGMVPKTCSQVY